MRRGVPFPLMILLLLFCPLLMGAAVQPTENFFVNDYGALLSEEDRSEMVQISGGLYAETGSRLVFLSAKDLAGAEPAAYADGIIRGWELTGSDALFLVYPAEPGLSAVATLAAENVDGVWEGTVQAQAATSDVMELYRDLAGAMYEKSGVTPGPEMGELLGKGDSSFGMGTLIVVAVLGVAVARAFRSDRKLKSKYLRSNVRPTRRYARSYNEEDEYNNEKIYKNTYDDAE